MHYLFKMNSSSALKAFSISVKLLSVVVTGLLWHITYKYIYKKISTDTEDEFRNSDDYTDCYKVIRMKIPSYAKGGIIGKNGSTIRRIQEKTKTTIKFLNKNSLLVENADDKPSDWNLDIVTDEDQSSFEIILIRGLTLRVMEAEREIKAIIASIPVYNEETMVVDNRFVGKIIGKKGENVKRLKECYKVNIDIDRSESTQRKINIRGTTESIMECRRDIVKTIDLIIKESKLYSSSNDEHLRFNNHILKVESTEIGDRKLDCTENVDRNKECSLKSQYVVYPGALNEKTYIFVCSVVDCCKFYAHIASDDLKLLTNLIDDMTDYFSAQSDNDETLAFNVGDIVVGYYGASHSWQRVKIIDTKDDLFEVIYLDYGDSFFLKATELKTFENCQQFLELPFQAIRLVTYGIKPVNKNGWSEKDINHFENLTKVGHCYKIAAVLRSRSTLSLEVQLIDEVSGIDVAQRLIADGIALRTDN